MGENGVPHYQDGEGGDELVPPLDGEELRVPVKRKLVKI